MTSISEEKDSFTQIPKKIGSYEITSEICSNFLGGVCTANHIYTDEQVAIKFFSKSSLQMYKSELPLINNEISVLKILNHKNIITLYEVFESSSHIYLITEYCRGKELFDLICSKKRLTESEAKNYFYQVISALDYMHSMNICHRNIKPENIVFDSKGIIKLIDFDFSCYYVNKEAYLNEELGTPSYACPEIHKGENYKPELADIWSCGILLYVMVCGNCPFNEENETENILQGNFEIPPYINNNLSDLIHHMIEPNPLKRYTFKDVFQHEWLTSSFRNNKNINKGVNYFTMKYPIDSRILKICESYGFDKDKIKNDLINNKFNNYTSMYKLCVKKVYNVGISCLNDFCSDEFNAYIEDKGNYYNENEKNEILKQYEIKEKERIKKLKDQEKEMINREEQAFKELNEIDKENDDGDLSYNVNEGSPIQKVNENLIITIDHNNNESYSEDDNNNNVSSSDYISSSNYSYNINGITQIKGNNINSSDNHNKANQYILKKSNSDSDSSFEICSAFPNIPPQTKLMTNLLKNKFSLANLNPNNFKSQPNIKFRKITLNPNKYKRYPVKRRNAIINRNEMEQTIRAYRTDLQLETSEESDDGSDSDESYNEHSSLELNISLTQTHNKTDSDYYDNTNTMPKDLNPNDSEYYNKLALELIEKEKLKEEERQRIIIEEKKRYDEEQKRKQQEQFKQKKEEEKSKKEEMRRKLQQRRLIAQLIHNVNRSQSLEQQNRELQLLGKAVDERNITLQAHSRSSSFTKRVTISFSEIQKLIKNAAKDIKTRRFSMKLSTNQKIDNANIARAQLRKTTVAKNSDNLKIPPLIIFEFPDDKGKQMRYSYIKKAKQNKLSQTENKVDSFTDKDKNSNSNRPTAQNENINDTGLLTIDTYNVRKKKKKGEILHHKEFGDKYNKIFIAELEELKMKTKKDEIKFKKEIEKLEKLKENQNEKYQIQMILIEQEKLRKLKENKQLIKKLEKEVIRDTTFFEMNNGVQHNKHNSKMINKKQEIKKKGKMFSFDKNVTKLPAVINNNKTFLGNNNVNNRTMNSKHKEIQNKKHSKQTKHKVIEQKIIELIQHSKKTNTHVAKTTHNSVTPIYKNNHLQTSIPSNLITPKTSHSKNNKNNEHKLKQQTIKLEKTALEIKLKEPKNKPIKQDKSNITSDIVTTFNNIHKNSKIRHDSNNVQSKNKKEKDKEKENNKFINPQSNVRNTRVNPELNNHNYKINFFHQQPDLNLSFSFLNAQNTSRINQNNNLNNQEFLITNTSNFCINNQSSNNIHLAEELNNNCFSDRLVYNTKKKKNSTLYKNNSKETSIHFTEYKDKASLLKNVSINKVNTPTQKTVLKKEPPNKSNLTKSIDTYNNETNNETFTSINNSITNNSKYIHNIKSTLLNRINKSKQIKHSHYKSAFNSLTNNISGDNNNSSNSLNKISLINIHKHSVGKVNSSTKTPIKQNDFSNRTCYNNNNNNNNSIPNLINKSMIQHSSYSDYNLLTTSTQIHNLVSPSIINSNILSVSKNTKTKPFINKTILNTKTPVVKSNTSRINSKNDNNKINPRTNKTLLPSISATTLKEPTYYNGLIDMSCISILNLKETINTLVTKLKKNSINFIQVNLYVYRCNKKKTSFDLEICQIYNKIYYYLIKVKSGGVNVQKEVIAQILND